MRAPQSAFQFAVGGFCSVDYLCMMMIDGLGPCCAVSRCFCFFGCLLFVHTRDTTTKDCFCLRVSISLLPQTYQLNYCSLPHFLLSIVVSTIRAFVIFARVHGHTVNNLHLTLQAFPSYIRPWYRIIRSFPAGVQSDEYATELQGITERLRREITQIL